MCQLTILYVHIPFYDLSTYQKPWLEFLGPGVLYNH
jgi:hypothetical protein